MNKGYTLKLSPAERRTIERSLVRSIEQLADRLQGRAVRNGADVEAVLRLRAERDLLQGILDDMKRPAPAHEGG